VRFVQAVRMLVMCRCGLALVGLARVAERSKTALTLREEGTRAGTRAFSLESLFSLRSFPFTCAININAFIYTISDIVGVALLTTMNIGYTTSVPSQCLTISSIA